MREADRAVPGGRGPAAVEFDTERFFGHFEGDPQRYRGAGRSSTASAASATASRLPHEGRSSQGMLKAAELDEMDARSR